MLMIVRYYEEFEKDQSIRVWILPLFKLLTYLYVTNAPYRQRIVWITFFLDAYIADRQFSEQTGDRVAFEDWADPREWCKHLGDSTVDMPKVILTEFRNPTEEVR